MSRTSRAMLALIVVCVVPVLLGLTAFGAGRVAPRADPTATAPLLSDVATITPAPPSATAPPPTPTLARREFRGFPAVKVAPTTFLPGEGPKLPGELVCSGRRLDFYVGRGTFTAEQVAEMAVKAEHALGYLQRRFATYLNRRVSIGVYTAGLAPSRGTRGIAHSSDNFIRLFYRPGDDQHKALVVLTHELAHQLQADAYGDDAQRRADTILIEGLATWISGEYWLGLSGAPSWQARSRELLRAGYGANLVALARAGDSDSAYELWAGFVDYLTSTYGWDRFNALYVSGRGRSPGSADYQGIYGKSLSELAREWRATLE